MNLCNSACDRQPDPAHRPILRPLGVRGWVLSARVSDRGQHFLVHFLLRHDHLCLLPSPSAHPRRAVRRHDPSSNGRSGHLGRQRPGKQQRACQETSGPHARHRRCLLLHLSHTLQSLHPLVHILLGKADAHPRGRGILRHPLFLSNNAVPQLSREPHPLQSHVFEVPGWFHAHLRTEEEERCSCEKRYDHNVGVL